jgi:hypothetical protein
LIVLVTGRRRWLKQQPGHFVGAARLSGGELDGINGKWRRGAGRWVRGVFVWTKGPFLFRNVLIPIDAVTAQRAARDGEVRRLGDEPVIVELAAGGARVEVAARPADLPLVLGMFEQVDVDAGLHKSQQR